MAFACKHPPTLRSNVLPSNPQLRLLAGFIVAPVLGRQPTQPVVHCAHNVIALPPGKLELPKDVPDRLDKTFNHRVISCAFINVRTSDIYFSKVNQECATAETLSSFLLRLDIGVKLIFWDAAHQSPFKNTPPV